MISKETEGTTPLADVGIGPENTTSGSDGATIYCALDDIEERGPDAILTGWMMLPDGPPDAILLRDGEPDRPGGSVFQAEPRERPDLASVLPGIDGAERSGFSVKVPKEAFRVASGGFAFRLVGVRGDVAVGGQTVPWNPQGDPAPSPPEAMMVRTAGCGSRTFRVRGAIAAAAVRGAVDRVLGAAGAPARVLEWGAGCGWLTRHFDRVFPGAERIAVDADEEALTWLAEAIPGTVVARPTSGRLETAEGPVADASVEAVIALGAGDLSPDERRARLTEVARVLRPGGAAIFAANGPHVGRLLGVEAPPLDSVAGWAEGLPLEPVASIEGGLDTLRDLHLFTRRPA